MTDGGHALRVGIHPEHVAGGIARHHLQHQENDGTGREQRDQQDAKTPAGGAPTRCACSHQQCKGQGHPRQEAQPAGNGRRRFELESRQVSRDACPAQTCASHRIIQHQAMDAPVVDAELRVLEQEYVDRILRDPSLDGSQRRDPRRRVDGLLEPRHQRFESAVLVAEVVIVAPIDVVVHGFGMLDHRGVELMPGKHLIQPLRPLDVLDACRDAHRRKLGSDDLPAAPCIGRRRELQCHGKSVGVAGLGQQPPRSLRGIGVSPREIHRGRTMRREVTANGLAMAVHGTVDDRAPIHGMGDGAAYTQIIERRPRVVQCQQRLPFARAFEHHEARIALELREALRRRIVGEHLHVARHQCGIGRRRVGNELEPHGLQCRLGAPVVIVPDQIQGIAPPPGAEAEWPGAHRMRGVVRACGREHGKGREGQALQQIP